MTTNKKLTFGIIALLIINLIILGVLFVGHKKHNKRPKKHQGPEHVIIKKLDFNEEQVAAFKVLKKEHREQIKAQDEKISAIKNDIFNSLGNENQINIDSLSTVIGGLQKEIEVKHYNHFLKVKALCKGEQVEKFNELSKKLSAIFSKKRMSSRKR